MAEMQKLIKICEKGLDFDPHGSGPDRLEAIERDILEIKEAIIHNRTVFLEALKELSKRLDQVE